MSTIVTPATPLAGADAVTQTFTGSPNITLPGTGTMVTLDATQTLTNKSLTSPTLTGVPVAPTAGVGTNTTQLATTAFVIANGGSGDVATDTIWDAKGDMALGTGANTAARLAVGSNGQMLIADSTQATGILWRTLTGGGTLVFSNTTVPAGNTITSTSETTFASTYTIPANSLAHGDVIRVRMHGVYSGTVLPTIQAKAKWGATVMLDTGALTGLVTGTNLGWWAEMEFIVQTIGATGTIEAQGYAEFSTAATTGLSVNPINAAAITIDTTAGQGITVTIQWGAGGTGQTITLREFVVEKLTSQASGSPATQAEMEAASSNTVFATPGRVQNHPGVAKAWVNFECPAGTSTVTIKASYNVASITDNGVGDWTINFTTAFSSAFYTAAFASRDGSIWGQIDTANLPTASAFRMNVVSTGGVKFDSSMVNVTFFGDQ